MEPVWGAGVVFVATETSVVVDLDVLIGDIRCTGFRLVLSTTIPVVVPPLHSDTWQQIQHKIYMT
jgi:hypothetical protein